MDYQSEQSAVGWHHSLDNYFKIVNENIPQLRISTVKRREKNGDIMGVPKNERKEELFSHIIFLMKNIGEEHIAFFTHL